VFAPLSASPIADDALTSSWQSSEAKLPASVSVSSSVEVSSVVVSSVVASV
jgi:hypothetical protein